MSASSSQQAAPHPLIIANLVAQIAVGLVVMTLCLPSMQEWSAIFQVPQSTVQLTFSAFVLAFGGFQLLWGPLSDLHGRRAIILAGLVLIMVGSLLAAASSDAATLIAARFVQGAGSAAGIVAGRAGLQDLFDGPQRTRVLGYVGMAMGLCPPLATVVGGQLHVRVGWQASFVLATMLAMGLWVAAWRGLHVLGRKADAGAGQAGSAHARSPTGPMASWLRDARTGYLTLLRTPDFPMFVLVLAFTAGAFYAFLGASPLVLKSYGVGPAEVGWFIMVVPLSYIVGNYATTRLAARHGPLTLMRVGQRIAVFSVLLMLAVSWALPGSPWAFALPLMLFGAGHGLLVPTALATSVGRVPALAGAAAALTGVTQQLMGALGGYSVGWVDHQGPVNLGALMLIFTLASMLALRVARRVTRPVA